MTRQIFFKISFSKYEQFSLSFFPRANHTQWFLLFLFFCFSQTSGFVYITLVCLHKLLVCRDQKVCLLGTKSWFSAVLFLDKQEGRETHAVFLYSNSTLRRRCSLGAKNLKDS